MNRYAAIMAMVLEYLPTLNRVEGYSHLCGALEDLRQTGHITQEEQIALRKWIHKQLGGHLTYKAWLQDQHTRYLLHPLTPQDLLEGRMQWVQAMIKQLGEWDEVHSNQCKD